MEEHTEKGDNKVKDKTGDNKVVYRVYACACKRGRGETLNPVAGDYLWSISTYFDMLLI